MQVKKRPQSYRSTRHQKSAPAVSVGLQFVAFLYVECTVPPRRSRDVVYESGDSSRGDGDADYLQPHDGN